MKKPDTETKPLLPPETKPAKPDEIKGGLTVVDRTGKNPLVRGPTDEEKKALASAKTGTNGPPTPDFEQAAKIIRNINAGAEKRAKLNGDLSADWKRVEDVCHVNKKAAKDARSISMMSDETQSDYLRSLFGLMTPLGIGIRRDMVDIAQGVPGIMIPLKEAPVSELEGGTVAERAMRETAASDKAAKGKAAAPPAPLHPADDSDLNPDDDAGEIARRQALANSAIDGLTKQ